MALCLSAAVLLACGGGDSGGGGGGQGTLTVSPTAATIEIGTSAVTFSAQLTGASGGVRWELSGPGSLSTTNQMTTDYTPPASGSEGTATLTVTGGGTSASVAIVIASFQSFALSPSEALVPPRTDTNGAVANSFDIGAVVTGLSGTLVWDPVIEATFVAGNFTPPAPDAVTADTPITLSASLGPCTARSTVTVIPSASVPGYILSPMTATVYAGGPSLLIRGVQDGAPLIYRNLVSWDFLPALGTLTTQSQTSGLLEAYYTPPAVVSSPQVVRISLNLIGATPADTQSVVSEITVAPAPVLSVAPISASVQAGRGGVTIVGSVSTSDVMKWSLSPAIGSLSASTGARTTFTPPSSVTTQTKVTISAIGGNLQRDVVVTIDP
jgi:hypothetical protein